MADDAIRRATVRVPGSTSNLGSGFDCVGFAVDRWLSASVRVRPGRGVAIQRGGTLTGLRIAAEDDLLHRGFLAACAQTGHAVELRLDYEVTSEIPVARGLGSSAAAFVAGARLASEALGLGLSPVELAELCAREEGHPDNAGPAALRGVVLGVPTGRGYHYSQLSVHPSLAFAFAIPEFEVSTAAARAVLPATLPHATAVAAAGKTGALVQGLARGDGVLLAAALDDVLHAPFRRDLIPGYAEVERAAAAAGAFGVTLSGSGSTLMAIAPTERADTVAQAMVDAWARSSIAAEPMVADRPGKNQENSSARFTG
jgi:homoserine kinase